MLSILGVWVTENMHNIDGNECIGVQSHMQWYFSYICDGTDMQADWRRSCNYGRAHNTIDIGFFNVAVKAPTRGHPIYTVINWTLTFYNFEHSYNSYGMHKGVQIWYDDISLSFQFIRFLNDAILLWPLSSRSLISGIIHLALVWGRIIWGSFS